MARAPTVTFDLPIRPEIGAVTRVYARLMRAVSTAALFASISATACWSAAAGVIVILPADRIDGRQLFVALHLRPDGRHVCLGPGKAGLRAGVGGLVQGRVDLVEHVARLDIGAFGKQALLDDAAHLGPHFGDETGRGAARQLLREDDRRRLHDRYGHFRGTGMKWTAAPGSLSACSQSKETDKKCRGNNVLRKTSS